MKIRMLFLVGAHVGSAVALAACSGGSSGGKLNGDAGSPTGGGATAGTAGGTHTVCTQAGQFDQQKATMHGCTSTVQATCEDILATKPCDAQFQALLTCAEAQPDTSWSCGTDGSTMLTGCDPQTAAVNTCATSGTSTTGATATTTAATSSGNPTSTTSGPSTGAMHPACAQLAQLDTTTAAAAGCTVNPNIQSDCDTALTTKPCESQLQAVVNCGMAQPLSAWSCAPNGGGPTLPDTVCVTESDAFTACLQ